MILMNDFKSEPEIMRVAMVAASRRVFESGWYVLGSEVDTFEKKMGFHMRSSKRDWRGQWNGCH